MANQQHTTQPCHVGYLSSVDTHIRITHTLTALTSATHFSQQPRTHTSCLAHRGTQGRHTQGVRCLTTCLPLLGSPSGAAGTVLRRLRCCRVLQQLATAVPATKSAQAWTGAKPAQRETAATWVSPSWHGRHNRRGCWCVPAPSLPSTKSESSKIFCSAQPACLQGLLLHPIKPGLPLCTCRGIPAPTHACDMPPPKCNPPPQNKQHAIKDGRTSAVCVW